MDVNGLEVLTASECIALLASRTLGRIALSSAALPVVLPVNYVLIDERILIRTQRDTELARAARKAVVAFEVDEFDDSSGAGWSVMVQGLAQHVHDPPNLAAARAAPLARWRDPHDSVHVGISLDIVSGRRINAQA